jgi:hypothetical protein
MAAAVVSASSILTMKICQQLLKTLQQHHGETTLQLGDLVIA